MTQLAWGPWRHWIAVSWVAAKLKPKDFAYRREFQALRKDNEKSLDSAITLSILVGTVDKTGYYHDI